MTDLRAADELGRANFGDPRLSRRLHSIAASFTTNSGVSIPRAMPAEAAREGAYRFLRNARVSLSTVLAPHVEATRARALEAGVAYAISDTTDFVFSTERDGLGIVGSDRKIGFLGHYTLIVSANGDRLPLGVADIDVFTRAQKKGRRDHYARKKDATRESGKWLRGVESAAAALRGVQLIHVMDREADIFEFMAALVASNRRFIIRCAQDRSTDDGGRLFETLQRQPAQFTREVPLSKRGGAKHPATRRAHPPRRGRLAQLTVAAAKLSVCKPRSSVDHDLPDTLELNVVRIWETDPPSGEAAVEWRLFTTEPIDSEEQIAKVVDGYRSRWLIEEYFKAIKTGCDFESAQLESLATLKNLLGIYSVLAWQMLLLRSASREHGDRPASLVLTNAQLKVLDLIRDKPLPSSPTVADAMSAVAQLGGHIKSNGPPGWQVLGRGLEKLRQAEDVYLRLVTRGVSDQS